MLLSLFIYLEKHTYVFTFCWAIDNLAAHNIKPLTGYIYYNRCQRNVWLHYNNVVLQKQKESTCMSFP